MTKDFCAEQVLKAEDMLCVLEGLQDDALCKKDSLQIAEEWFAVRTNKKPDRLQSDPTALPQSLRKPLLR